MIAIDGPPLQGPLGGHESGNSGSSQLCQNSLARKRIRVVVLYCVLSWNLEQLGEETENWLARSLKFLRIEGPISLPLSLAY